MLSAAAAADTGPYKEDLSNQLLCPDCKTFPPDLVEEYSSGDMVCNECGIVVGSRIIDTRSEWRTFANDDQNGDDPSRVGGAMDEFSDVQQLSTSVAFSESKAHKALARNQNNASKDKGSKSLEEGYRLIVSLCEVANAGSNIQNAAKHVFKLVEKEKGFKGKPQEVLVAGAIQVAFRQNKATRSFKEIFELTGVPKKDAGIMFKKITAFVKKIKAEGRTGVGLDNVANFESRTTSAGEYCARFTSRLGFKQTNLIAKLAKSIAEQSHNSVQIGGRSPLSIAAACIYMACHAVGEPKPSSAIADKCGVSDGTIKTTYKFLYNMRDQLIQPEWVSQGARVDRVPGIHN
ncbi:transcription initiation protein [Emericellopsis atlantica]|uniref:Transcription initiation factor IIB n=1 Tax=Emericellopsis atlantica TaxID=2614577 RepID=A0A9P8CK15_9HYPO|nr:transcription initiation protein [Emericellopsis atlantica]KAG9249883.1 transcription initiation protein [Emericellopsis atlantica]